MAQQTCGRGEHEHSRHVGKESMDRADMMAQRQLLEVSSSFHCGLGGLKSDVSQHGNLLPLSHLTSPTRFYFLIIGKFHDSPNLLAHCINNIFHNKIFKKFK